MSQSLQSRSEELLYIRTLKTSSWTLNTLNSSSASSTISKHWSNSNWSYHCQFFCKMKFSFSVTALLAGLGLASAFPSKFTLVADGGHTVLTDGGMYICCYHIAMILPPKTAALANTKLSIHRIPLRQLQFIRCSFVLEYCRPYVSSTLTLLTVRKLTYVTIYS